MSRITLIGRENAMLTNDIAANIRDTGGEVNKQEIKRMHHVQRMFKNDDK